jgi:hypothetical protein
VLESSTALTALAKEVVKVFAAEYEKNKEMSVLGTVGE